MILYPKLNEKLSQRHTLYLNLSIHSLVTVVVVVGGLVPSRRESLDLQLLLLVYKANYENLVLIFIPSNEHQLTN